MKWDVYFILGVVLFGLGACWIHWGLGMMLLGGVLLFGSYVEYDKTHGDDDEGEE